MPEPTPFAFRLIEIVPSIVLGLICIRATCAILDLRSNRVYATCHLLNVFTNIFAHVLGIPEIFRAFVLNPTTTIIMPIAYSRGPLRSRVTRTLMLCFSGVIAEVPSVLTFMLLGHGAYYDHIDASNAADIALTYCITCMSAAITYEAVIARYRHLDRQPEATFEAPVLTFMFACFLLANLMIVRLVSSTSLDPSAHVRIGVASIASLVYGLFSLSLARRDAVSKRALANSTAQARQERHVRARIHEAARRGADLRRLRHDLANQVEVVGELASKGYAQEADRYLADLQAQAATLTGGQACVAGASPSPSPYCSSCCYRPSS